ncbi:MAG: hypothetical protein ACKV0T_03120 [Planctomycetales bacterium]
MRQWTTKLALLAALVFPQAVRADGLIYRLPEDGTGVTYDMELKRGQGMEVGVKASFKLSSVGTEMVNGDKCRWIEIRLAFAENGQERTILSKMLIPEKHLGKGKSAGDNLVRAWIKMGDMEAMELKDLKQPQAGPLAAFLAGPDPAAMKLDPIPVENAKLGKLECAGEIASHQLDQGGNVVDMTFEHRLSEKAPFGVLASKLKFTTNRDGNVVEQGSATFTLTDISTTALSELPNNR